MIVINRCVDHLLYASDVAEMIGYHAINIHPDLNGFSGYDCIHWMELEPTTNPIGA